MKQGWFATWTLCVICTAKWAAVWPTDCCEHDLERPSCGAQDSEILEYW